jgi:hypothetical protein
LLTAHRSSVHAGPSQRKDSRENTENCAWNSWRDLTRFVSVFLCLFVCLQAFAFLKLRGTGRQATPDASPHLPSPDLLRRSVLSLSFSLRCSFSFLYVRNAVIPTDTRQVLPASVAAVCVLPPRSSEERVSVLCSLLSFFFFSSSLQFLLTLTLPPSCCMTCVASPVVHYRHFPQQNPLSLQRPLY